MGMGADVRHLGPYDTLQNDSLCAQQNFNLDFSTLDTGDVLENFDFDSFLNTDDQAGFSFDPTLSYPTDGVEFALSVDTRHTAERPSGMENIPSALSVAAGGAYPNMSEFAPSGSDRYRLQGFVAPTPAEESQSPTPLKENLSSMAHIKEELAATRGRGEIESSGSGMDSVKLRPRMLKQESDKTLTSASDLVKVAPVERTDKGDGKGDGDADGLDLVDDLLLQWTTLDKVMLEELNRRAGIGVV
jgi:hypothetical protein